MLFGSTIALAACASDGPSGDQSDGQIDEAGSEPGPVTAPVTTTVTTTSTPRATSTTTSSSTSTSSTTTTTTIAIPDSPGPLDFDAAAVGLGRSVEGRPIVAERFGTPGGRARW